MDVVIGQVQDLERSVAAQGLTEVIEEFLIDLQVVQAKNLELVVLGDTIEERTESTQELHLRFLGTSLFSAF